MFRSIALTTLLALGLAASTFAATPTKEKKATEKWATGQVERYDASTSTLVLKQAAHEMTFMLASNAKLTEGKKAITGADLGGLVGHEARVRYMSQGDTHQADHVQVMEHLASKKAKAGK